MDAISIEKFGNESVLRVKTVDVPKATGKNVLVKVICAGVNPVDTYIRDGAFVALPQLPFVPGKDGSGIVHQIGEGVTKFAVGDRVFICDKSLSNVHGTYGSYSLVEEENCFPLSEKLTFEEGAALGTPYFTAIKALNKCCLSTGDYVLIHGATGAVGTACIQAAKHRGFKTIGTYGTARGMDLLNEMGVGRALCHKEKDYMDKVMEITDNKGVQGIIEMLANENLNRDLDVLSPSGRIIVVGCRGSVKIDPRKMMVPETQVIGLAVYASTPDEWSSLATQTLSGIEDGWIRPHIHRQYPLSEAKEAHRQIMSTEGARGKIVLTVQEA